MKIVNTVILILLPALILMIAPKVTLAQNAGEVKCDSEVVVQADDWLSKLADKFYGDALAFPAIAEATNRKATTDPSYAKIENVNVIEPGWKLCLPSKQEAQAMLSKAAAAGPTQIEAPPADEIYAPVIDPANFVTSIDNPYFPLSPGTIFVYEGKTEKGNEYNETYVTPQTKVILGVTCVVVSDTVKVDGQLEEATLDWYAQDKQGNVWYMGEDSKEYQDSQVVSTKGSWEAGVDGALPGIIMQANPQVGQTYRQEYYKGEAEDMAAVVSLSESVSVPYASYTNLLMTKEWSALDTPPVIEYKYYAKGVGFIMTRGTETGKLKLVEIRDQQGNQTGDQNNGSANQGDQGQGNGDEGGD